MSNVEVTTDVTLNSQSVSVTVYEDLSGGTTADNQETVSVATGTNTYQLSNLDGGDGASYWVDFDLSTSSETTSPIVHSATVSVNGVTVSGTSSVSTTATATDVRVATTGTASATTTATGSLAGRVNVSGTSSPTASASGQTGYPAVGTTLLPDAAAPTLGNGVEDEVAVTIDDVTNYGEYRLQIRETGQSTWDDSATGFAEQTVASDSDTSGTIDTTFAGLEDGEEYEVRARTETEHRVGAWTDPVSIVTQFPGAANPSVVSSTSTSVTIDADDNADNEDGFRLEREEQIDGTWRDRHVVLERGAHDGEGEISMEDDSVTPAQEYRYRVEAYTEHASATSDWTAGVETPGLDGVTMESTGSRGWTVRVEHDSGSVHRPRVIDATRDPSVSDLPSLEVTVPRDDKWTKTGFEDAAVKAYKDGKREPVETLVDTRVEADRHVLVMEGAQELRQRVTRYIDQREAHSLAEDLLTTETSYGVDVDDPQSGDVSESLMQSASTNQELLDALQDQPSSTDPWRVTGDGQIEAYRTCWTREAEDADYLSHPDSLYGSQTMSGTSGDDGYGIAVNLDTKYQVADYVFTLEHDVPNLELALRWGPTDVTVPAEVEVKIGPGDQAGAETSSDTDEFDGESYGSFSVSTDSVRWADFFGEDYLSGSAPELSAGTYTLRLEVIAENDGAQRVDVCAPYDDRYSRTFDNSVTTADDGSNHLDSPTWYPDISVVMEDAITDLAVLAGRFTGEFTDTSAGQQIELSNDQGSTYPVSGSNTSDVEGDFPESGGSIRARVTLSSYGTAEETPATGRQPQALDSYSLYATLDETPLIINQNYDNSLLGVLQNISDAADAVFAVLPDGAGYEVVWTWPRQRESDLDPGLVDYSGGRTTEGRAGAAVVQGASQSVAREEWTAALDEWVDLTYSRLQSTSVDVWDPSGTVSSVEEGEDYEVDRSGGRLKALSSGSLADGEVYAASYEWKAQGSYESPDVDDPRTVSRTIAALSSNRACGQAARRLVEVLQEPRYSASIQVSTDDLGWNVIEALQLPALGFPEGVWLQVRRGESEPGRASFELGRGQSVAEVMKEFRDRVSALEGLV